MAIAIDYARLLDRVTKDVTELEERARTRTAELEAADRQDPRDGSDHDQALTHPDRDRLGTAACAELGKDGGDVKLDGVVRDAESRRDGLVAESLGDQAQDLDFTRGEALIGDRGDGSRASEGCGPERRHRLGVKHHKARGDRLDGCDDFLAARVTRQDGTPPSPQPLNSKGGTGVICQHDDAGR